MVKAREDGTCCVCLGPYAAGDDLGLMVDGWAHLECYAWTMEPQGEPC